MHIVDVTIYKFIFEIFRLRRYFLIIFLIEFCTEHKRDKYEKTFTCKQKINQTR
jgi:hypothetical protein